VGTAREANCAGDSVSFYSVDHTQAAPSYGTPGPPGPVRSGRSLAPTPLPEPAWSCVDSWINQELAGKFCLC